MKKFLMMAAVAITMGLGGNALAAPTFQVNNGVGGSAITPVVINTTPVGGFNYGTQTGGLGYWDAGPTDGGQKNVGNYLTKTGGFSSAYSGPALAPVGKLGAFQQAGGTAYSSLSYGDNAVTSSFRILIEVAGFDGVNQLWYRQGNILKRIFNGSDSASSGTATIVISGEFDLYLIRGTASKLSDGMLDVTNASDDLSGLEWAASRGGSNANTTVASNNQHFASFINTDNPARVFTGIEDLVPLSSADRDYNDFIISMLIEEVPAPPAIVLAALGVPALGLVRRFTRKTAVVA